MLQALGTIRFRFLQKKSKKNFHACVPLKEKPAFRVRCLYSSFVHGVSRVGGGAEVNCMVSEAESSGALSFCVRSYRLAFFL